MPRKPCGRYLMGKCTKAAEDCPFPHNKDLAPLCKDWVSAKCSSRCYRRHYYLESDSKVSENQCKPEYVVSQNIPAPPVGGKVTIEHETKIVTNVDLDTGKETTTTQLSQRTVIDLTEENNEILDQSEQLPSNVFDPIESIPYSPDEISVETSDSSDSGTSFSSSGESSDSCLKKTENDLRFKLSKRRKLNNQENLQARRHFPLHRNNLEIAASIIDEIIKLAVETASEETPRIERTIKINPVHLRHRLVNTRSQSQEKPDLSMEIEVDNRENAQKNVSCHFLKIVDSIMNEETDIDINILKLTALPYRTAQTLRKTTQKLFQLTLNADSDEMDLIAKIMVGMRTVQVTETETKISKFIDFVHQKCDEQINIIATGKDCHSVIEKIANELINVKNEEEAKETNRKFDLFVAQHDERCISFARLLKCLYSSDFIPLNMVHSWLVRLINEQTDKSLEFFCILLKILGKEFEADTNVWQTAECNSEILPIKYYLQILEDQIKSKKASLKVLFMMNVVTQMFIS